MAAPHGRCVLRTSRQAPAVELTIPDAPRTPDCDRSSLDYDSDSDWVMPERQSG